MSNRVNSCIGWGKDSAEGISKPAHNTPCEPAGGISNSQVGSDSETSGGGKSLITKGQINMQIQKENCFGK